MVKVKLCYAGRKLVKCPYQVYDYDYQDIHCKLFLYCSYQRKPKEVDTYLSSSDQTVSPSKSPTAPE